MPLFKSNRVKHMLLSVVILACCQLTACGQKAGLYLPPPEKPSSPQ